MKKLLSILSLLVLSFSCSDQFVDRKVNDDKISVDEAMQFYSSEVAAQQTNQPDAKSRLDRHSITKNADWQEAYYKNLSIGSALIVPIKYDQKIYYTPNKNMSIPLDALTKLLFYKNKNSKLQMEVVTSSPNYDSTTVDSTLVYNGTIFAEKWNGDFVKGFIYKGEIAYPITSVSYGEPTGARTELMALPVCNTTSWTVYVGDCGEEMSRIEDCSTYTTSQTSCSTVFIDDGGSSSSDGESASSSGPTLANGGAPTSNDYEAATNDDYVVPGSNERDNLISNPREYFSCFDRTQSAAVTIYVDQPNPGYRDTHVGANVGHTFISISQKIGSTYIVRVFGFYPESSAKPSDPVDQGSLGDDNTHQYDVSLTVYVTSTQLMNALNYALSSSTNMYNLNTYNCTNFGIQFMSKCGVALPVTTGTWPGGQGCDPGDLGEDLKSVSGAVVNTSYAPNTSGVCSTDTTLPPQK